MAETKSMRVVPSGKIYRQMFEAQVQLNRSLTKLQRDQTSDKTSKTGTAPLVHLTKDDIEHGLLGERQKTWADGFPNDPYIENPVVYKQYADYVSSKMKEPKSSLERKEVRGLPDVVAAAKESSNIIERIAASRKERHEATIEEMHQELSIINSEMEPKIEECCKNVLMKLQENDKEIAGKLNKIVKDEDLLKFSLPELNALWDSIQTHSELRQSWIYDLDTSLKKAEDDRMIMIRKVFKDYAKAIEKIAHVLAPDLHRLMDKESQLVNQTVLSNRRAYGDLFVRLMSTDIEREKSQHNMWKRRVEDWKMLKTELAIQKFKLFMQDPKVVSPPGVDNQLQVMLKEQQVLNDKRLELIKQLNDFVPPSATKTSVYQWNNKVQDISREIDSTNQSQLAAMHKEYENVCQLCLDEIELIKKDLVDADVCSESRAKTVIDEFMLPLVGDRQRIYEHNLETMEKTLEEENKHSEEKLESLFKFAQGAAHMWDVHEIGLAHQERALQEKLEQCRVQHDIQNQDKEAHLDIMMDRMRQDATEKALKDSLTKVLEMLEKIRRAYEIFHKDQATIVKQYPDMIKTELKFYDEALCKLFLVDRSTKFYTNEESSFDDWEDEINEDLADIKSRKKATASKTLQSKDPPKDIQAAINEVLQTKKGTTFYVLTVAAEHGISPEKKKTTEDATTLVEPEVSAFMTEVSALSGDTDQMPDYVKSIEVTDSLLNEIRKTIRLNFLDHLEEWTEQAYERACSVVVAKSEELNSELDLRLHLHKPRARRAEYDVHNVRAAELVMHSERVTRHCKGITQALTEVRNKFTNMTDEHNHLATKFRQDIEALEMIFINATKASKLYDLKNQLNTELDKYMAIIRASLRQFRQHLDETLQMLRESNARFIKSIKVFSDGGNFCPEEIEEYRKRLDKMAHSIDRAEGAVMSDLEDMESKRLEQATKVTLEFEDRFKCHMFDLIFMEKIARWLTNTQVKIKAEVANSNSQACKISQQLENIEQKIDACERPNLDKQQISAQQLNDSLMEAFEVFHYRSAYLNCLYPWLRPPSGTVQGPCRDHAGTMQGPPATGARVGFVQESGYTPISKAGKQPSEDPSLVVIKGIMRSTKSKLRFGVDAELDGDNIPNPLGREKMKSSMSNTALHDHTKINQGHHGPSPASGSDSMRKSQSAVMWRTSSKTSKFEKRVVVFGEASEDENNTSHFLSLIKKILKESLEGLFTASELFYRQKGVRPVTRPQALQETYELCTDAIVQKLQSYYQQADEYHNQCLQEFRSQLIQMENLVSRIPQLLISDLVRDELQLVHSERSELETQFRQILTTFSDKQKQNQYLLRPNLGHPYQKVQLDALCQQETDRHNQYMEVVEKHTKTLLENVECHAKTFLESLARMSENQLLQYDNMLVVDDVAKGCVETKKYPTVELIRRKNAGLALEDNEDKNILPRGKNTWSGLPNNELVCDKTASKPPQFTASVTTSKTTLGHSATVMARDMAYMAYKEQFDKAVQDIKYQKQSLLVAEQRWMESWDTSVEKIKMLY